MKRAIGKPLAAFACVCAFWLLLDANAGHAEAQTSDAERAARIRDQLAIAPPKAATDKDVAALRDDLNRAMEDVVKRISALEKDMIDMQSRMRVLEVRAAVSNGATDATETGR